MDLKTLHQFTVVAQEGHITRAAERLGMQQPPLSQKMKAFEREIGVHLLRRKGRGIELTDAGKVLLEQVLDTLARYDHAVESTHRAARGELGRLIVGMPPTAPFHPLVPSVIRSFRESYPLVKLTIEESLRNELIAGLINERLDVVFMRAAIAEPPGITMKTLLHEPMVVALPSGSALAKGRRDRALQFADLHNETFIVYARETGPAIYEATMDACRRAGFAPRLGQEAPRVTSALTLVAVGLGITVVPESMCRMAMHGITYRTLKGPVVPTSVLGIAFRRADSSAAVRNILSLVQKAARTLVV